MASERPSDSERSSEVRLDIWLWAARFFKTRALAAESIDGGKVTVNGERAKRSRRLRVGDDMAIRLGPYEHRIVVQSLSARRGPATEAASLYRETGDSIAARERIKREMKANQPLFVHGEGKPDKKERRAILRLKKRDD
jgi:ribosome-associated heat shock protein Hsp15